MKPSKDLLRSLENKLKSANVRSPYLTATIGRSRNRIDLQHIDLLSKKDEELISKQLLNQLKNTEEGGKLSFDLQISSSNVADKTEEERFKMDVLLKRLQNIHFDQEEDFLEHGTKSFGFGFPLLAMKSKQDKNRTILAPLFIWYMDLKTLPNNHHAYKIERTIDHPIIINPQLAAFLANDQGYVLDKIPEEYLDNDCLSEEELNELTENIAKLVNADIVKNEEGIESIKDRDYYDRMVADKSLIFNSGIFTLFKSNKESIVSDYQKMINGLDDMMFDNPDLYQPYQEDFFSAVQLDPSQEGIIRNIGNHKKIIIQGPPGTGKSNSLTGIILNALENEAKILVVCEKKTALEVLFENLSEKGLEEFCAVIDNVNSDRQKIVKQIREKIDERDYEKESQVRLSDYMSSKSSFINHYNKTQKQYGNLLEKVLGDLSWKDCIGNYLKAKREAGNESDLKLSAKNFQLTQDEFFHLLANVKKAAYLKERISDIAIYFKNLNKELFKKQLSTAYVRELKADFEVQLTKINDLQSEWENLLNDVSAEKIKQQLQPNLLLKIMSLLNSNLKNQIKQSQTTFSKSQNIIAETKKLLVSDKIINKENPLITVDILKELETQLEQAVAHFNNFRDYYEWKNFYITNNNDYEKQLIDELDSTPYDKWEFTFRKWYFNLVLMDKELDLGDFPTNEKELETLESLNKKIDAQQSDSIREIWYNQQRLVMKNRTLQEMRQLFNLRANKKFGRRNSLRNLMFDEFDLITSFFPVMLVNPSVSSSIFPLKPDLFDLVIFDEASQLRLEDTYPSLLRGRFKVISGDIHQMPPSTHFGGQANTLQGNLEDLEDDVIFSEEESLLTYAQNADFEFNYLDFHYRSRHPHLIEFSNAAFYNKRLVPMPPTFKGSPLVLREVDGVYADNANDREAEEIINIIFKEIKPNEKGEYPSIGVATLNTTQQRYIWEKIWDYADKDETFRTKLADLESAGFFIKNLENIQGDQRDIIIISTTFGKREDGSFIQNFGPLNRDKGYKLLNVIVTRAKNQVYLVTSIPSEFYSNFRSDIMTKGNTGKGIFYAYINYVKFCHEGNERAREELLNFLMEDKTAETPKKEAAIFLTESVFEEEVIEELVKFVPKEYIQTQFQLGGFRLDIVVKDKNFEPKVVIECDGKTYHSSKVAYRYDIHRQNIIERHGLKVYRIWSTNWWRNKERESKKLQAYLHEKIGDLQS